MRFLIKFLFEFKLFLLNYIDWQFILATQRRHADLCRDLLRISISALAASESDLFAMMF